VSEYNQERELPSDTASERALLGTVLLENRIPEEMAGLDPDDLFLSSHRRILAVMKVMAEEREPIGQVFLTQRLMANKELEAVGGAGFLADLTTDVLPLSAVPHYIRRVRNKALARRAIHASEAIAAAAYEGSESVDRMIQQAQDSFLWLALESSAGDADIFEDIADFCAGPDREPDWLIEGLIERGSNGIVAADPKGMKSLTTAYMAACLGLGLPWLQLAVKQRVRVALVSREDNPETTKRRLKHIVRGLGADMEELRGWVHVNSKKQSPSMMLDNPKEVANLIRCIKRWGSEFVIFDVLNKLHTQDENDNTKLRMIMNQIDRIQAETGAQACVLHHLNKGDPGQSITRRLRGAGAIAGFAEWIAGIEVEDEASKVRCMKFETKAGSSLEPIYYRVSGDKDKGPTYFNVVHAVGEPEPEPKRRWEK
jgi:hypothetical protein